MPVLRIFDVAKAQDLENVLQQLSVEVTDPFGNRIRFNEDLASDVATK